VVCDFGRVEMIPAVEHPTISPGENPCRNLERRTKILTILLYRDSKARDDWAWLIDRQTLSAMWATWSCLYCLNAVVLL
jgi:hypothetical protein